MSTLFAQSTTIHFTVYGRPQPQGSIKAFVNRYTGRAALTSDNSKLKPWRQQISETALSLGVSKFDRDTPLELVAVFYFTRPPSAKKRIRPTVKPDGDKLLRAIADSLSGILFVDDAQVVDWASRKYYGDVERVEIIVREAK